MKADKIIKNAKIFTADKSNPQATALAVKDGKFVYVGDEAGLADYDGASAAAGYWPEAGHFPAAGAYTPHSGSQGSRRTMKARKSLCR